MKNKISPFALVALCWVFTPLAALADSSMTSDSMTIAAETMYGEGGAITGGGGGGKGGNGGFGGGIGALGEGGA